MRSPRLGRVVARVAALALVAGTVATALPTAPAGAAPAGTPPPARENSASRIIFWSTYCSTLADMTDRDLERWARLGAGGFSCAIRQLAAWGGGTRFTADPDLPALNDPNAPGYDQYELQRKLRDTRFAERAREHGLKLYLGVWSASDLPDARTPFVDWFDDEVWADDVIPQVREMAGAIHDLGFAGITLDHENYASHDNPEGVYWSTEYGGNRHSPAATRRKIRQRGRQVGRAITAGFPGVEYAAYFTSLPVGWNAYHQYNTVGLNDTTACDTGSPTVDFWEGMAGARGYDAIRFWEAVFFKPANSGSNFEAANQYNTGEIYAYLSRCWSNWRYASSRVQVSPFVWLDGAPDAGDTFNSPYPRDEAGDALAAFSKWGTGGEFANFAYSVDSDYGPYRDALEAASTPRVADDERPTIRIDSPARGPDRSTTAATIDVTGTAHDNLAIRSVSWTTDHGASGMAPMTWHVIAGDGGSEYFWTMRWEATAIPLDGPTCITITATDIKDLKTSRTVPINGRDACAP